MIIQGKYYIFQRRANNFFHFGIKQCSAFLFLTCKTSLLPLIVQGGPSDWLAEKIILASLRYFFAKPCTIRAKDKRMHVEKNICMIDYQIFVVNTAEKSYGFNHTGIRRQRIIF